MTASAGSVGHPTSGAPPVPSSPSVPFGGIDVVAGTGCPVPRPWTLLQAAWAAELAATLPPGTLVELCTGAGPIGLEAARRTGRRAVLVDRDERACRSAAANAERNGLAASVEVRHADLDAALRADDQPALLLADPPYLPADEVHRFPDDPRHAVDGGHDGLAVARHAVLATAGVVAGGVPLLVQLRGLAQVARLAEWIDRRDDLGVAVREVRAPARDRAVALLLPAAADDRRLGHDQGRP